MKNLIRKNSCYYSAFLVLLMLLSTLLLSCTKEEVTLWVNAHYSTFLDYFFVGASLIGDLWFAAVVLILLLIWKGWRVCLQAFLCIFSTALVVQFLKNVIFPGTPRPTVYFEGKEVLRLIEGVVQLQTESFPSGHTAEAFALATFFALILAGKRYHWLLVIVAACVGYARIYLSQHFITDVYLGMIIGVVVTTLVYWTTSVTLFKTQK